MNSRPGGDHGGISMKKLLCIILLSLFGCAAPSEGPELKTVDYVDLDRYLGTWYEIANYPTKFQKGCYGTIAIYTLREDGKIRVENRCKQEMAGGKESSITGVAWAADKRTNAKLKVQFFWPFRGDYWIIELDSDYKYAVVGHPKRKFLWILSRSPVMKAELYIEILDKIKGHGYDLGKIVVTKQSRIELPQEDQRHAPLGRGFEGMRDT